MKVLITASRHWADPDQVWRVLDEYLTATIQHDGALLVIHGDCPTGGDRHAREWASARMPLYKGLGERRIPAQWAWHGKRAGFIRNQVMVDLMPDVCLAFTRPCADPKCADRGRHISHGTADTMMRCNLARIPVREFREA